MKETIEVTKKYRFFKANIIEKIYVQAMDEMKEIYNPFIIRAQNLKEAENAAEIKAKEWFFDEKCSENEDGEFEFFDGIVIITIEAVIPTTYKKFLDEQLADMFIDCKPGDNKIRK